MDGSAGRGGRGGRGGRRSPRGVDESAGFRADGIDSFWGNKGMLGFFMGKFPAVTERSADPRVDDRLSLEALEQP